MLLLIERKIFVFLPRHRHVSIPHILFNDLGWIERKHWFDLNVLLILFGYLAFWILLWDHNRSELLHFIYLFITIFVWDFKKQSLQF